MNILLLATGLLISPQQIDAQKALDEIRLVTASGVESRVRALFVKPNYADGLVQMSDSKLTGVRIAVIPAPPGFEAQGPYWAIFYKFQDIQQYHDPIYPIVKTADGWKLGREIPEWEPSSHRVRHAKLDVRLFPAERRASIDADLELQSQLAPAATVFRLNDRYQIDRAAIDQKAAAILVADDQRVPKPKAGDIVRAGGLVIYWSKARMRDLDLEYRVVLDRAGSSEDNISANFAYITAYWVPTIGRQPHTTATRIQGPKGWVLRSEGVSVTQKEAGFEEKVAPPESQIVAYKCDIPISFPKVCAGAFKLAAEITDRGRTFRSWQMTGRDSKQRAEKDVQTMADFCRFFDDKLGPFPFRGYEVFDGIDYYGIESYSYTILAPEISGWATSHEMGHTYFGGLVPCSYTRDTWNEGMTQYIDSILFRKNSDRTLENGLRTVKLDIPLAKMDVAWANGSATYWRGAYVMNMLSAEIGQEAIYGGLRAMINDRRGKDTTWPDIRQYFERSSGKKLGWFWDQWISNALFPTLDVIKATLSRGASSYSTNVVVRQSGTSDPFRMRFIVRLRSGARSFEQVVTMSSPEGGFTIATPFAPSEAAIDVFPYTLARIGTASIPVRGL